MNEGTSSIKELNICIKKWQKPFFELSLIVGNAFTRKLTPYEEAEQVRRLKEALIKARDEDGLEIEGKLRDVIAEMLNTSGTQIARMEAINNNLVEEAKEQFKEGNLSTTSAYETSKLPEETQKEIAEKVSKRWRYKS